MPARDKIYISKSPEVQELYSKFTEDKDDTLSKPFRFDRDVFLAAAVAGHMHRKAEPLLPAERKEKFNWGTLLNDQHALPVLQAIALLKTGDPNVLLDDDQVASIAEAYANAGIHLLAKRLVDTGVDELQEAAIYMAEILDSIVETSARAPLP